MKIKNMTSIQVCVIRQSDNGDGPKNQVHDP